VEGSSYWSTGSVLVVTLNSLLNNNEFIKVANKRQEAISSGRRFVEQS
jgi:hypothetical protein